MQRAVSLLPTNPPGAGYGAATINLGGGRPKVTKIKEFHINIYNVQLHIVYAFILPYVYYGLIYINNLY